MKDKKRIIILSSIILGVLILTLGITFALTYVKTGSNQSLVLGDIYMHYNETKALTIEDAMPGAPYSNYFEFIIKGKNTGLLTCNVKQSCFNWFPKTPSFTGGSKSFSYE